MNLRPAARTAAPRSSVVHMVAVTGEHRTACGRPIGDEWAGEYTEQPEGPVSCRRCLPHADAHAADIAAAAADVATFAIGQRVGILTGVQSVNGPWVRAYGTVVRYFTDWGTVEYIVDVDGADEGSDDLFPPYLLRSAPPCVCTDADGFGHRCAAYPAGAPVGDVVRFGGMTLDEIDADAAVSTGGMPAWESGDEVPTGDAALVARFSQELAAVLSPRSWQEMGRDEARARSMAAHPAGKGRPTVTGTAYRMGMPPVPEADGSLYF